MAHGQGKVGEAKSDIVREIPLACADEAAAVEFFERMRWGDEPCCPCCGSTNVYQMKNRETGEREKNYRWRCRDCKKLYSVRKGTVYEESRIPMRHWAYAFWAACSSKKGVSAKQIQRQTGLSYKSALFMMHRIRHAMAPHPDPTPPRLTGVVEADETYVGGKARWTGKAWKPDDPDKPRDKFRSHTPVLAIVKRGGEVRVQVVQSVTAKNLREMVAKHVETGATVMTDELPMYRPAVGPSRLHRPVHHSRRQYAKYIPGEPTVHTNTVEGFFSLLKRGMYGTFHSVSKKHLHRYVDEFAFRYNARKMEDGERTELAIKGANGKRLMYREPTENGAA